MRLERITWLGIRLAGFFFLYWAVENLIGSLGIVLVAAQSGASGQFASVFLTAIAKTAVYSISAWYLLTDGSHVHRLLMAVPNVGESDDSPPPADELT
jgi:hypothetical protein